MSEPIENEWQTGKRSVSCYEREIKDLKQQRDDLLEACKAQEKADNWFGPSDTGHKLKEIARKLSFAAIAKCDA